MYGVNAAIILQNIYFWVLKNKANKKHFYDGKYWTYNSRSAFNELFPYLSERQIKTAIDKLVADGVIQTGCYNEDTRDRTLWYTVTKRGFCILQKCGSQAAEMSDANDGNVTPLPYINQTDINTDINHNKNTSYSCSEPEKSVSKPKQTKPTEPVVYELELNDGSMYGIPKSDYDKYVELYPAVDVMQQFRKMTGWIDASPNNRKTRKGIKKFINGWLSREQDKGGNVKRVNNQSQGYAQRTTPEEEEQKRKDKEFYDRVFASTML